MFVAVLSGRLVSPPAELLNAISGGWGEATVQAFDADSIAGLAHLLHSVTLAISAWKSGKRFTRRLELELLCYAAADHQISEAVKKVGVGERTSKVVLIALAEKRRDATNALRRLANTVLLEQDPAVLELSPAKVRKLRKTFSISDRELEAADLEDLVLERVASLSLLL